MLRPNQRASTEEEMGRAFTEREGFIHLGDDAGAGVEVWVQKEGQRVAHVPPVGRKLQGVDV